MKFNTILMLMLASFLLGACGSVAAPEPVKPEVQSLSTATSSATNLPPLETPSDNNSPVASPTISLNSPVSSPDEVGQNSPVATPLPTEADGAAAPNKTPETTSKAAIIFQRSGGVAGLDERWTISLDGQVTGSNGYKSQIEPEQVQQLLKEIETLGFFEMNPSYIPENPCCDRFTYKVTVRNGDNTQTVTTVDAAAEAPQALWQVIDAISRFLG